MNGSLKFSSDDFIEKSNNNFINNSSDSDLIEDFSSNNSLNDFFSNDSLEEKGQGIFVQAIHQLDTMCVRK